MLEIILLMLDIGRMFLFLPPLGMTETLEEGTPCIRFPSYSGWTGKVHCYFFFWRTKRNFFLYAIDHDGQDHSVLCPLRAFRLYWDNRDDLEEPNRLWMSSPDFLARAVLML